MNQRNAATQFAVKDCALVVIATGKKARALQEFRDRVAVVEPGSIYHHFWGGLLEPRFEEREFNNDFAAWVRHGLHDEVLAERLAALDPTAYSEVEELRQDILELVDERLDEAEYLAWHRGTRQFEFIRSQIVVFDTDRRLAGPEQLGEAVKSLSTSSIFYHFIDARRRNAGSRDDFSEWLGAFGDRFHTLQEQLAGLDPYFGNLSELRRQLFSLFHDHFSEGRT